MFENQPLGVTINAIITGLEGVLSLVTGLFLLVGGGTMGMLGFSVSGASADAAAAGGLVGIMGAFMGIAGIVALVLGVLFLFLAKKLLEHRNWARIVVSIFAALNALSLLALNLFGIIGAIQLYYLWFDKDTKAVFS